MACCHDPTDERCVFSKHNKRHTRPYGCTYTSCPRRFGSKNDWKRHENNMHWQIEAWKCAEPRDNKLSGPHPTKIVDLARLRAKAQNKTRHQCGQVFYRREQFQAHLEGDHKLKGDDGEYVREQCRTRRIGRNGQKGFWCGFCQTVVELKKRGLEVCCSDTLADVGRPLFVV